MTVCSTVASTVPFSKQFYTINNSRAQERFYVFISTLLFRIIVWQLCDVPRLRTRTAQRLFGGDAFGLLLIRFLLYFRCMPFDNSILIIIIFIFKKKRQQNFPTRNWNQVCEQSFNIKNMPIIISIFHPQVCQRYNTPPSSSFSPSHPPQLWFYLPYRGYNETNKYFIQLTRKSFTEMNIFSLDFHNLLPSRQQTAATDWRPLSIQGDSFDYSLSLPLLITTVH